MLKLQGRVTAEMTGLAVKIIFIGRICNFFDGYIFQKTTVCLHLYI